MGGGLILFAEQNYRKNQDSSSTLSQSNGKIRSNLNDTAKSKENGLASKSYSVIKRKDEIAAFSKELLTFNLSFSVLVSQKPKKKEERDQVLAIAKFVSGTPSVKELLLNSKELPDKTIIEEFNVPNKFIRANKFYLIAMSLLLIGPYSEIQSYLLEGLV